jgi:uncharacterized membrane protein
VASDAEEPTKLGRIAAIDVARGVALAGMVVYHLIWDFAHFGLIAPSLPFAPATRVLGSTAPPSGDASPLSRARRRW